MWDRQAFSAALRCALPRRSLESTHDEQQQHGGQGAQARRAAVRGYAVAHLDTSTNAPRCALKARAAAGSCSQLVRVQLRECSLESAAAAAAPRSRDLIYMMCGANATRLWRSSSTAAGDFRRRTLSQGFNASFTVSEDGAGGGAARA